MLSLCNSACFALQNRHYYTINSLFCNVKQWVLQNAGSQRVIYLSCWYVVLVYFYYFMHIIM